MSGKVRYIFVLKFDIHFLKIWLSDCSFFFFFKFLTFSLLVLLVSGGVAMSWWHEGKGTNGS